MIIKFNILIDMKIKTLILLLASSCVFLGIHSILVSNENKNLSLELDQWNNFNSEFNSWLKKSDLDSILKVKELTESKITNPNLFFKKLSAHIFNSNSKSDSLLLEKLNKNSSNNLTMDDLNDLKKLKREFNNLIKTENTSENNSQAKIKVLKQNYEEKINKLIQEKQYLEKLSGKNGYLSFKSESGADINYVGEIENNLAHGYGIALLSSGFRYEGQWNAGKKEGYGIYYYKNNERYEGDFLNGKREGKGTYFFSNGHKYVGKWKNDKRNGLGYIEKNNENVVKNGMWENDKFIGKEK
jgi:hypothetical protein